MLRAERLHIEPWSSTCPCSASVHSGRTLKTRTLNFECLAASTFMVAPPSAAFPLNSFTGLNNVTLFQTLYCANPPSDSCPYGPCPNPDITGFGTQVSGSVLPLFIATIDHLILLETVYITSTIFGRLSCKQVTLN